MIEAMQWCVDVYGMARVRVSVRVRVKVRVRVRDRDRVRVPGVEVLLCGCFVVAATCVGMPRRSQLCGLRQCGVHGLPILGQRARGPHHEPMRWQSQSPCMSEGA